MGVINYKGYHAKIEYSSEDNALIGRVLDVNDLLTFEARTVDEVEEKFQQMINDYISVCAEIGKKPEKPFSGSFNVRVSPEVHRKAVISAAKSNKSLNQFIASAIEEKVNKNEVRIIYTPGVNPINRGYETSWQYTKVEAKGHSYVHCQ